MIQQAKQEIWDAKSISQRVLHDPFPVGENEAGDEPLSKRHRDAPSYGKSCNRYVDIPESRMDYVEEDLITKPSDGNDQDNEGGNANDDEHVRDIDDKYDNTEQGVKEIIAYVLALDASTVFSSRTLSQRRTNADEEDR